MSASFSKRLGLRRILSLEGLWLRLRGTPASILIRVESFGKMEVSFTATIWGPTPRVDDTKLFAVPSKWISTEHRASIFGTLTFLLSSKYGRSKEISEFLSLSLFGIDLQFIIA